MYYTIIDQFFKFSKFFLSSFHSPITLPGTSKSNRNFCFSSSSVSLDFSNSDIHVYVCVYINIGIYILEAKHDKPSPRTRTPVTGVFVGSGRRNTIIFPPRSPASHNRMLYDSATSIKGTFLFSLRCLPI